MRFVKEFSYLVIICFLIFLAVGITGHSYNKVKKHSVDNLNEIEKLVYNLGEQFSFGLENSGQITLSKKDLALARKLYVKLPERKTKDWQNFENKFNLDQNILISLLDVPTSTWRAYLLSLKTKDTLHVWSYDNAFVNEHTNTKDLYRCRLKHPYMLPDTSLVFEMDREESLYCLDKDSELKWKTSVNAHHSINPDADSNLWFCSWKDSVLSENFWDEELVHINKDGKVLQTISLYNMMKSNGFYDLIASSAINRNDVFHLNDIEPVLKDSQYWKKGDLFVSLRNLNMVLLYRPSNDSVLWHSFGPWHSQHDVDVVSDSTILVFNNNKIHLKQKSNYIKAFKTKSNLICYNFANNSSKTLLEDYAEQSNFLTNIEGSQELLNDSIVILEETMKGRYHLVNLSNTNESEIFSFSQILKGDTLYPRMNWFRMQ